MILLSWNKLLCYTIEETIYVDKKASLVNAIKEHGFSIRDIYTVTQAVARFTNVNSITSDQKITVSVNDDNFLQSLSIMDGVNNHKIIATRTGDGFFVTKLVKLPDNMVFPIQEKFYHRDISPIFVENIIAKKSKLSDDLPKYKVFTASIHNSLYNTARNLGIHPNSIIKMVEAIEKQSSINLNKLSKNSKLETVVEFDPEENVNVLCFAILDNGSNNATFYNHEFRDGQRKVVNLDHYIGNGKGFVSPVDPSIPISSHYGNRYHPIKRKKSFHKGIDYATQIGTPVYAASEGEITVLSKSTSYGNLIKIKHQNGYLTLYAHLSKFAPNIKSGANVRKGELIGFSGDTGMVTGPHLHFETLKDNKHINPLQVLSNRSNFDISEIRNIKETIMNVRSVVSDAK
ncbi:MAG: peptidase, M23/M37 family domain protein [Candidatus Xenolissoclinum pacificiensis L6]|uniref:Peptidase, M23/M37 family domain protein n=1 Tax=Candidatus Xenolissoclinum pacificiensis L6 TaxID=1401685 RepID=W2V0L0_9RICK|nr:MAG: peptidase, M23/M37 family domain protein [Candidatus Xenolissoclinum pacificiensis L6]